jgi:hypothetical protein
MATNQFNPRKYEDFEILDGARKKVGEIRVKPSGILWAPKGSKRWYRVDLATFAKFMETEGTRQNQ